MRTVRTISEVRAHVAAARAAGRSVGLVLTMGAFHDGHLALMRAARASCDEVVVSLFVNPAQFEEAGDLAAYPRDEARDARMAAEEGVDVLFAPGPDEVYPAGFATTVTVGGLGDILEGAARGAGHFAGVCTVVTKLLNIVAPDAAFFGQKDAQQVAVVRRMVRDLDIPVRIETVPTVRDPDGLAMSSRNGRLDAAGRTRALALSEALRAARDAAARGDRAPAALRTAAQDAFAAREVEPEYVALVDPDSFRAVAEPDGRVLMAVAARIGATRLIDNAIIDLRPTAATGPRAGADHREGAP
jgi:pantoate--beta-alanine ligase